MKKLADISAFERLQNQAHAGFVSNMSVFNADREKGGVFRPYDKWRIKGADIEIAQDEYDVGTSGSWRKIPWPGKGVVGKEFDSLDELLRSVGQDLWDNGWYDKYEVSVSSRSKDELVLDYQPSSVFSSDLQELTGEDYDLFADGEIEGFGVTITLHIDKVDDNGPYVPPAGATKDELYGER